MMEQMEAIVAAQGKPAVVIAFSLGCRIAKVRACACHQKAHWMSAFQYFLHFCHAKRGDDWMGKHVDHFVPLGGPFLGAVPLLQAVMVVCSVYLCTTVSDEHMCRRMEPSHLWTFSFLR